MPRISQQQSRVKPFRKAYPSPITDQYIDHVEREVERRYSHWTKIGDLIPEATRQLLKNMAKRAGEGGDSR